jgi:hypothetical protein
VDVVDSASPAACSPSWPHLREEQPDRFERYRFSDTTARSVRERVVASVEALLGVARDLEGMASAIER